MRLVVVDFETYYDQDYTLQKLTTEEYVTDPRFEIILCGFKEHGRDPWWVTGTLDQLRMEFAKLQLAGCALVAHNMFFDGLILAVHFGIYPKMYIDTLFMAQAQLKPYSRSISLDSCLKHLDLGIHKGSEVHNMKGRSRLSLSHDELHRYANYCMTDCEGEYRLFRYLAPQFTKAEFEVMDLTLRMYLQPTLLLDSQLLAEELQLVQAKKAQSLASLPAGLAKADMMSNPKFAEALQALGVDPPIKISPTTGAATWAFAKSDTGWKELEEEYIDDPIIGPLLAARISAKSTLEEARTARLLKISMHFKHFRVPLKYYAAHTGRYGGMESINAQNFPRIDKSKMRFAIRAPAGYVIIAPDLKSIEARIVAWLAGQTDLCNAFRNKLDIYSEFAADIFKVHITAVTKTQRFVGKTCILGLGFGMGAPKLQATLRKDGLKYKLEEVKRFVEVYRNKYGMIPLLWRRLDNTITHMATGQSRVQIGPVTLCKNSIALPNGMAIVYNALRQVETAKYKGWAYSFAGEMRTLWGGKVTENIVQALAFVIIKEYMLQIWHTLGLKPAMQNHDELDYVIPFKYAEKVKAVMEKIMRVPPSWAPDLPIDVEVNYGPTFGDCK